MEPSTTKVVQQRLARRYILGTKISYDRGATVFSFVQL